MTQMQRNLAKVALLFVIALIAIFSWLLTRGNTVWRIHQHYPQAVVYFDPANSPDPEWSDLVRMFGFKFYSGSDPIGVRLADTSVDFNHFRGMTIGDMHLRNCKVTDVGPLLSEYHPYVTFQDCDLRSIPKDQMQYVEKSTTADNVFYVGNLPLSKPYVKALHDYSLFP